MPFGEFNPAETSEALTVAPVVALYSPIVLLPTFVSKICPRAVPGIAQSAATATAATRAGVSCRENRGETFMVGVLLFIGLFGGLSRNSHVACHDPSALP